MSKRTGGRRGGVSRQAGVLCLAVLAIAAVVAVPPAAAAAPQQVWTDPQDPSLPPDFKIQGEYAGEMQGGGKLGAQVIALNDGAFQAVLHPGGLPGDGWDGKNKMLMEGRLEGDKATFKPAEGTRKYLAGPADQFAATRKCPPDGHQPCSGQIAGGVLSGKTGDGKTFELKKVVRKSPTLEAKPPAGAIVLFDGSNKDEWNSGRLDEKTKLLNTDGKDITTKRKFNNYVVHAEFMLPYRPAARGQGRGNSGFYQIDMYEVQILDSFGLEGANNECSGIYSQKAPLLNMCFPPLTWQTYDIEFTNAVAEGGKKTKNSVITVKLNGVVVHDKYEITGKTGGARGEPEGTPGPLKLQGHGNPLQFRNLWIVEK
jgi:hypothetical protein